MSTLVSRPGPNGSRGGRVAARHERRTDYPDLSPTVKAQRTEPALSWKAWTDREVIVAEDVDPEEWPAWTDEVCFRITDEQKGS